MRELCFRHVLDITEAESDARAEIWEKCLEEHDREQRRLDSKLTEAYKISPKSEESARLNRKALDHSRDVGWKARSVRLWKQHQWVVFWQLCPEQIKQIIYGGCLTFRESLFGGTSNLDLRPSSGLPQHSAQRPARLADQIRRDFDYADNDLIEVLLAVAWQKAGERDNAKLAAVMKNKGKIRYSNGQNPRDRQRANPAAFRSHLARLRRKAKKLGFEHLVTADYLAQYVSRRVAERVSLNSHLLEYQALKL